MIRGLAAIAACCVLLTMGGCASSATTSVTPPPIKANSEVAQKRFECLKSKGWDVRLERGAILSEIPSAHAQFDSDDSECLKKAGFDPDAPISEEQFKEIFASYKRIEACLKRGGWATPKRPSFEGFVDTYESSPWIPWNDVPPNDLPQAGSKCPEMLGNEG